MSIEQMKEKMVARRVSKGYNLAESITELEVLVSKFSGDNLAFALCYEAFATEAAAYKFVKAVA